MTDTIEQRIRKLEQWCDALGRQQQRLEEKLRAVEHLLATYLEAK